MQAYDERWYYGPLADIWGAGEEATSVLYGQLPCQFDVGCRHLATVPTAGCFRGVRFTFGVLLAVREYINRMNLKNYDIDDILKLLGWEPEWEKKFREQTNDNPRRDRASH